MTVAGARAVNRDQITGTFNRNFNTQEQILTLSMDREWDTLVDPMDIQQDAIVTLATSPRPSTSSRKSPRWTLTPPAPWPPLRPVLAAWTPPC